MIWESAGILGVDPRPLTFWQLVTMRLAKLREAWWGILAIRNCLAEKPAKNPFVDDTVPFSADRWAAYRKSKTRE